MTTTQEDRRTLALEQFAANVVSGRALMLTGNSHRSVMGYVPMMRPDDYGKALAILGRFVTECGGPAAELVACAVRKINVYGTAHEMVAAVAYSFADTMQTPYDDVAARTGPEPVRHSAAQRDWTLHMRLTALCVVSEISWIAGGCVPGYGWALAHLCEQNGVRWPDRYPPPRGFTGRGPGR